MMNAYRLTVLLWTGLLLTILTLAALPVSLEAQGLLAAGVIAAMLLRRGPAQGRWFRVRHILFALLGLFISLRYLSWRTLTTLPDNDPLSLVAGVALYLAELYSVSR